MGQQLSPENPTPIGDSLRARIARLGPIEGLRISDELRRQVVRQNPEWPSREERHNDLAAHTRLSELLRRASRPRSR